MMITMGTFATFALLGYIAIYLVVKRWGLCEINPAEYHRLAGILYRYPHLQRHLQTFRKDGRITSEEMRRILSEAHILFRRHKKQMDIKAKQALILPLIDDPNKGAISQGNYD